MALLSSLILTAGVATTIAGLLWFLAMAIWPAVFPFFPIGPGLILIGPLIAALAPRGRPLPDVWWWDADAYDTDPDSD